MRSILKYNPLRQFSTTNKLGQVIHQTAEQLKQQQSNNYLKYEDLFFKLYTSHIQRQQKVSLNVKHLDSICMLGDFPCRSIVEHFHITAKTYNEEYTVQTFVRLARAYKISQADNASTADFSINRLFFTPEFENLIEEYKYGLRKEHAMRWDNAFLVAECLIEIGYVDYEVFSILMNMVETRLNKQQRNETEVRHFQIQKRNYYLSKHRHTQQNLANDTEFQAVLKMLAQHVRKHEITSAKSNNLKQLETQLSSTEQSQNIYHSILDSVSAIESYNQNITKLIQGIITIRKQYRKMVQLSHTKDILRNPEFNLELLELEEMLLVKKIISMADIKTPERIDNEEQELKRIQEILVGMIEPEGITLTANEISEYLNASFGEGENKQTQRQNKLRDIAEYGRAMATLTRFAQVSRRLYNSPDSRSLISMKWQKTLLGWTQGGHQSVQWQQNLHAQKIFRRTFADLYRMMKRSYSIFMFTFIEAPLRYKIQFFEALTRLGFHDQLIHLQENEDFSKERVENYSNAEFFSLIKVLNEMGTRINAEHLKKAAVRHLKKLYDETETEESESHKTATSPSCNASLFTMQFCTLAVNFICQNFNVHSSDLTSTPQSRDQIQILYDNLITLLTRQVKYLQEGQNFLTNDHLYEALRVLSMQRSGQFTLSKNFYGRFGIDVGNKKQLAEFLYRKNPFTAIVQELCEKYQIPALRNVHPFIQTGFNSKGEMTAVLLCSSDQSSMDGKHATGNTNAYIHRVRRQFNITITPLTVNSFLQIDYQKLFQNKEFTFRPRGEISLLLNQLFKRDQLHLIEFSSIVQSISSLLQKHYKRSYIYGLVKFLNTLNQCVRLFDKEKEVLSFQLWRMRRLRLFVQLDGLKEDYNGMDKAVKEELEKLWRKQATGDFFKKHSNIITVVQAIQHLALQSVDPKGQQPVAFTKQSFQGKRFSIQTFVQQQANNTTTPKVAIQFVNTTAYIDKTYCHYQDWAQVIRESYPLETVKLSETNNVVKILAKRFLPYVKDELTLLPFAKTSTLKTKPEFHINSLDPVQEQEQNIKTQKQKEKHTKINENQLLQIRELLSFVHELKVSKSEQELIDYIFSFDFISQLGQRHEKQSHGPPLPRDHGAYFNHLQAANNKLYLQSPNLEYLFQKLQQRQQISQVMGARKQRRSQVMLQYKLGNISRHQYIKKCQKIDDQIISKLQTLNKNILDNVEEYKFFQNGLKMVKLQKDQKEIQRVLNRARYYYRNLDKDFVHVKGNTERCLKIKRSKAERMLALYNVLYKLGKGDTEVTEQQKEVVKREAAMILFRLENKKDHADTFSERFTHLTVGDLSKTDKERLRLDGSDLSKFHQFPITDLILELVHLLDPKIHQNFQKSIMRKYYSSTHNLPQQLFLSGLNKEFTKLAHEQQRSIINQKSKLDSYEVELLNEMVQTFKTESKTGKERFAQIYGTFYEDMQELNNSEARVELITEYLNQKEIEYMEDYNPKLVTEIKEREVLKLWNVIFRQQYQQSDTQNIKQTVAKLCERIRFMGENTPPFFGLLVIKILSHPRTDFLSKENLISTISQFKTPLKIDSEDVRRLGEEANVYQRETLPDSEKLNELLGLVSNKNFMEKLNKRVNMIV